MKKALFFLSVLCMGLASCGRMAKESIPELSTCGIDILDNTYDYFCTPYDLNACKPLVLINTRDGWVARYGGSEASDSLTLKPVTYTGEYGETLFYFEEYYAGKRNGKYVFDNETFDMDASMHYLYYVTESGTDSIRFSAKRVDKSAIETNPFLLSEEEIASYDGHYDGALYAGRLLYEIYANPEATLRNGVAYDSDVFSTLSEDGNVRIYNIYYSLDGHGLGNLIDFSILQYKTNEGISIVAGFSNILYDFVLEEGTFEPNFAHADTSQIFTAAIDGKTNYLVETEWWDEQPVSKGTGGQIGTLENAISLSAFRIINGKFEPVNLFEGVPIIVRTADKDDLMDNDDSNPFNFFYNNKTRELIIPIIGEKDYSFWGSYDTLKL